MCVSSFVGFSGWLGVIRRTSCVCVCVVCVFRVSSLLYCRSFIVIHTRLVVMLFFMVLLVLILVLLVSLLCVLVCVYVCVFVSLCVRLRVRVSTRHTIFRPCASHFLHVVCIKKRLSL